MSLADRERIRKQQSNDDGPSASSSAPLSKVWIFTAFLILVIIVMAFIHHS